MAGTLIASGVCHSSRVNSVKWSPDEKQLVSVGDDCSICVWSECPPHLFGMLRAPRSCYSSRCRLPACLLALQTSSALNNDGSGFDGSVGAPTVGQRLVSSTDSHVMALKRTVGSCLTTVETYRRCIQLISFVITMGPPHQLQT